MAKFISESTRQFYERIESLVKARVGSEGSLAEMTDEQIASALDNGANVGEEETERIGSEAVASVFSEAGVEPQDGETHADVLSGLVASASESAEFREGLKKAGVSIPEKLSAGNIKTAVESAVTSKVAKAGVPQSQEPDTPGEGNEPKTRAETDKENAEHYQKLIDEGRQEERTDFWGKHSDSILRGQNLIEQ